MSGYNYSVTLVRCGSNTVSLIKEIREITGLGLKEAKDITTSLPYTFPRTYSSESAKNLADRLASTGAHVEITSNAPASETPAHDTGKNTDDSDFSSQNSLSKLLSKGKSSSEKTQTTTSSRYSEKENVVYIGEDEVLAYFRDILELETQVYIFDRIRQLYAGQTSRTNIYLTPTVSFSMNGEIPVLVRQFSESTEPISTPRPDWLETDEYREINKFQPRAHTSVNTIGRLLWIVLGLALLSAFVIFAIVRGGSIFALFWLLLPMGIVGSFWYMGYDLVDNWFPISMREYEEKNRRIRDYFQRCADKEYAAFADNSHEILSRLHLENRELVVDSRQEAVSLLHRLYGKQFNGRTVINPNYRNFSAAAQMYDYISSRRCLSTHGPNGTYALYDHELKQSIISRDLSYVSSHLDQFSHSMPSMCEALRKANSLLDRITESMAEFESNNALRDYNETCVATNRSIVNRQNV